MKKLVCLVLALALCLLTAAMAESVPSKTTSDLTRFDVVAENQPNDPGIYLLPVNEVTVGAQLPDYQELLDICQVEIEKLGASETVEAYFEGVKDREGTAGDLKALLDAQEQSLNVFELCPVIAGGFKEGCGDVTATMLFATPYEKDEPVLVLIGIVTMNDDATQAVAWTAFEAVGLEPVEDQVETAGRIQVKLAEKTVLDIQNQTALLAVVSK